MQKKKPTFNKIVELGLMLKASYLIRSSSVTTSDIHELINKNGPVVSNVS